MSEGLRVTWILVGHFFRRFFDNDTVQVEGDTLTTVVRAVSVVAAPGLMIAFFLQNQYPRRPLWGRIEDEYFFVLFSFVVMGAVSIFEWEMLFPDRLDFQILTPLSLKPAQMLGAKAAALVGFLAVFLVGSNLLGGLMLPMVSKGAFWRQVYAQGVAVVSSGMFAALLVLAVGGVLLCVLDAARFRRASPVVQMLSVAVLVLLMLQYLRYGDSLQVVLTMPLGRARWMPPLWFLGIYERLLRGDGAPAFAREMMGYAVEATGMAAAVVLLTYPLAWARMRRMAIEGSVAGRGPRMEWIARLVHAVIRRPGERAVFHFVGQSLARNNRYQVYLAMYCGTGLALALGCSVGFQVRHGRFVAELSQRGLHAVMPLLLFWAVVGLRIAFAFPLNLKARWVFRITGVKMKECAAAARRWAQLCAVAVTFCVMAVLWVAGWDLRHLLVQAVYGLSLCVVLADGFFFSEENVPFIQPRMPGRANFPLMLTLWAVLPVFVIAVVFAEMRMERRLGELWMPVAAAAMVHGARVLLSGGPEEVEEEMQGYEGEFQLLGLS